MDRILTIKEVIGELENYSFRQLHLHHTWKPAHSNFNGKNHQKLQQGMRNFHINSRGWADIGQHLTLFPDGKFVTGRPFSKNPASIKGWNNRALAVEMIGNFDTKGTGEYNSSGYDKLEGLQKQAVLGLIKWFGDKYGYGNIKFHREGPGAGKTCPGTSLDKATLIAEAKGQPVTTPNATRPTPKPTQSKIWRNYISGQEVKNLQSELNKQFEKNIKVDGWFGNDTINALVNVKLGAKGNLTRIIQRRLRARKYDIGKFGVDGVFGKKTEDAVKRFQSNNRLRPDGIVGVQTWKALFKK